MAMVHLPRQLGGNDITTILVGAAQSAALLAQLSPGGAAIPTIDPTTAAAAATAAGLTPEALTEGANLMAAEASLLQAFNSFQQLRVLAPTASIPADQIAAYTAARADFVQSATAWVAVHGQMTGDQVPDPGAVPVFPPELAVIGSGLGGFQTGQLIPLAQIVAKYGPVGQEKVTGLGYSLHDPLYQKYYGQRGLGFPFTPVIIILALLAFTAVAITFLVTKDRGPIEVARAEATRAQAEAACHATEVSGMLNAVKLCIGTSTDNTVKNNCVTTAGQNIQKCDFSRPSASPVRGVLATIGLIVVVGGLSVGGYALYRHYAKRRDHGGYEEESDDMTMTHNRHGE